MERLPFEAAVSSQNDVENNRSVQQDLSFPARSDNGISTTTSTEPPFDWFPDEIRRDFTPGVRGPPGQTGPVDQPEPPGEAGQPGQPGPSFGTGTEDIKISHSPPANVPNQRVPGENNGSKFDRNDTGDGIMQSDITYIFIAAVICILVVTFIVLLLLKRRHVRSKLKKSSADLRQTDISFINEEEQVGFHEVPYKKSDLSVIGRVNPSFLQPKLALNYEQKKVSGYKIGTVNITKHGGIFQHPHENIFVTLPKNLVTQSQHLVIINGPVKNLPKCISKDNILSDMITLLPHNTVLNEHVLICFPIDQQRMHNINQVQMLYSNSKSGTDMLWVNLKQKDTGARHKDAMCWFLSGGYCFLYASHFCHVFMTQHCSLIEQPALFLKASVHARYDQEMNKITLHFGFHCSKCHENLLSTKGDWGTLLWSGYRCIYGKEGDVTISVNIDDKQWKCASNKKEIDVDDLLNLCQLEDVFPPHTFMFRNTSNERNEYILIQLLLSQGNKKPIVTEVEELLDNLIVEKRSESQTESIVFERSQSDPVEHCDTSLGPVENLDSSQDDMTFDGEILRSSSVVSEDADENTNILSTASSNSERNDVSIKASKVNLLQQRPPILPCETTDEDDCDIATIVKNELPNDTNFQILPFQEKVPLFGDTLRSEEKDLCDLLGVCADSPLVLKTICETHTNVDPRNFNGQMVLQMLGLKIKMNLTTWEKINKILLDLHLGKIAKQLNFAVDKNQLVQALDNLKMHLQIEPLLSDLVVQGVVTPPDAFKMRSIKEHAAWLDYLVYKILFKKPASGLYVFYDLIQKSGYQCDILKPVTFVHK